MYNQFQPHSLLTFPYPARLLHIQVFWDTALWHCNRISCR